jgi:putative ABC transport system permease protein
MAGIRDENTAFQVEIEPGDISVMMVDIEDGYSRADIAREINKISGLAAVTSRELMSSSVASRIESLTPGLLIIGAGFWLVTVLMIGALFSMVVNERRRELGLLQAMGATRRYVFRMVLLESVELTFLGGVLGLLIGGIVMLSVKGSLATSLGIAFLWPEAWYVAALVGAYLILAMATGAMGALYPATRASRLEPYQAIRTGE